MMELLGGYLRMRQHATATEHLVQTEQGTSRSGPGVALAPDYIRVIRWCRFNALLK
jgi:hypothetical protein